MKHVQKQLMIDTLLEEVKKDEPGVVLMGEYDNGEYFCSHRGLADLKLGTAVDENTLFDIASLSKQFTACCIYILDSRKKLSLEDSIRKYLPELPNYAEAITIRHLLNHTSGIIDYIDLVLKQGIDFIDNLDNNGTLQILSATESPSFPPGSQFCYSNSNYVLLAIITERISGKTLNDFATETIFRPLGMTKTFYNQSYPIRQASAQGYDLNITNGNYSPVQCIWTQTGDGAVFSSCRDLIKWGKNLSSHSKLNSAVVENLLCPMPEALLGSPVKDYVRYSAGLSIQEDFGQKSALHSGSWIGFSSFFVRHLESELTIVALSNREDFNTGLLAYKASEILLNKFIDQYEVQTDMGY